MCMGTKYTLKPGSRSIKEEQIERIVELYNNGMSVYKIANELGFKRYQPIIDFFSI